MADALATLTGVKTPPYWAAGKELKRARTALAVARRRPEYLRHALGAMRNACELMGCYDDRRDAS